MKTKLFLCAVLCLTLFGCSLFRDPAGPLSPTESNPQEVQTQEDQPEELPVEEWLLPDPALGLASLASYQQDLTIRFQGTRDETGYEWTNVYQRSFWKETPASFLTLKTSETGLASTETLIGVVDQAHYSRLEAGTDCQVRWGELAEGADAEQVIEPARLLPPVSQATEVGTEAVNGIPARHYTMRAERSGAKVAGDFWQAQEGGYLVRYELTISGGEDIFGEGREGEQSFRYELSQVNGLGAVVYPEGCVAVLSDFPVMEEAKDRHRLPQAVNYTVSVQAEAVSQFYQETLLAQGWEFVNANHKDPQNLLLTFVNEAEKQAVSILLQPDGDSLWVSAIMTPWQPTPFEMPVP